jgi:hypothetical protein
VWPIVYVIVGCAIVAIPYLFAVSIARVVRWIRR